MDELNATGSDSLPNKKKFDESFNVCYQYEDGATLNASVKQLTEDHFEAYVAEKEVVIHCTKDKNGVLFCKLNTNKNPAWVDHISEEIARKVT